MFRIWWKSQILEENNEIEIIKCLIRVIHSFNIIHAFCVPGIVLDPRATDSEQNKEKKSGLCRAYILLGGEHWTKLHSTLESQCVWRKIK